MGEKKIGFTLPEQKVTIKFIKRKVGMAAGVGDDHVISGGMLEGSKKKLYAPMTRSGGIKNILTKEEKEFFEEKVFIGQSLSAYGPFWKDYYVELEKTGAVYNLSDPHDYLKYKLLLAWSDLVAPSLKDYREVKRPSYQFYMELEGEDERIRSKELAIKKQAYKNFNKVEDDAETLAAILYLMTGKKMSDNAKLSRLNDMVSNLVDTKPEKFNQLIDDTHFDMKIFAARAEKEGIIKKGKLGYETMDGLPVSDKGRNKIDDVVAFLLDPVNDQVKELIIDRLENTEQ